MEKQYRKKSEQDECCVCYEQIKIFAIGECGHSIICWKCTLKQRLKLGKKECPYCKNDNQKLLLTEKKSLNPTNCHDAIFDPETNLYYENQFIKNYIAKSIGYYCQLCQDTEYVKKFPSEASLEDHLLRVHKQFYCQICKENKPDLLCDQVLYTKQLLNQHYQSHPNCFFCILKNFYDKDQLNSHYNKSHEFCGVCKKQGQKRQYSSRFSNLPEYEVYRDMEQLRIHYKSKHFVCNNLSCIDLVFEDRVALSSHLWTLHGQRMQVQVGFGNSDDEEEEEVKFEEEKKSNNVELTKTNYKDLFPTLTQVVKNNNQNQNVSDWPGLTSSNNNNLIRPQTSKVIKNIKQTQKIVRVSDKQSKIMMNNKKREERKNLARIERQVENTDYSLEYREEDDIPQIQIEQRNVQQNIHKNKKKTMKKTIVQKEVKEEEDHKEFQQKEDFPSLGGNQSETNKSSQVEDAQWSKAMRKNIQPQQQPSNQKYQIDKKEFPALPRDQKPQKKQEQKDNNQEQIVMKRKKKKKNQFEYVNWNKLETVDYSKTPNYF